MAMSDSESMRVEWAKEVANEYYWMRRKAEEVMKDIWLLFLDEM